MHFIIELGISLNRPTNVNKSAIKKPSWSKISADEIMNYSMDNIDWNYSCDQLSSDQMLNELQGKFNKIMNIVPVSRFDTNNRPLNLPWSNSALKRMRRNKDIAWNCFDEFPSTENFNYAMEKDRLYSDEEFRLKTNYERKLTNNLKTNCKGFYSYLRNKRQLKTGVPMLDRDDGSRTTCATESAEELAEAFSSVFVREPEELPNIEIPEFESESDFLLI